MRAEPRGGLGGATVAPPSSTTTISLQAFYVAATIAALVQWWRVRQHRLLVLLALFLCLAVAHHQPDWYAARPYHFAAGVAGLALLVMLGSRPVR